MRARTQHDDTRILDCAGRRIDEGKAHGLEEGVSRCRFAWW